MTIQQTIAKKHYAATEAEVEALAQQQYAAAETVGAGAVTYLRVLVAGCQAKYGRRRGPALARQAQAEIVEGVHARFYNAVLRGITTADIAHDANVDAAEQRRRILERNRRSAFARSAVSTLRLYVSGGGDIRALNVETVTKGELRKAVAPPEPTDKVARQISRAQGALLRAIQRRARGDPDAAAEAAEAAIQALEGMFAAEPEPPAPRPPEPHAESTVIGARRSRAGIPVILHRPAAGGP